MLDDRKLEVLKAIVTDYVSRQEPIGSKALVEHYRLDVSPATVRNDMAVLEEEGYLIQPHTSAGRIPTDKGYRLFVDRLAEVKPLSAAERRAISTFLEGAQDADDIVLRTVRLLAQITRQIAIVQYPVTTLWKVRHVDIISLSSHRVLIVVITSEGRVKQCNVDLANHDEASLNELVKLVNRLVCGRTTSAAAEALVGLLDDQNAALSPVIVTLLEMLTSEQPTRVAVGGVPNLTQFGLSFETAIRPMLEALEEQVVLLRLLGEAVATSSGDVAVRIGEENSYEDLRKTSVVASAYGSSADTWAALGIVGPTRMDYPANMAAVRAIARYVGRFLAEG